jgi:hypothetical protein
VNRGRVQRREEKEKKLKREKEIGQNETKSKKISLYRAGKKY